MLRRKLLSRASGIILSSLVLLSCPAASSEVLPFHYYTTKDGLISSRITALYQDSRGYLWIGTNSGLSRYDGIEFTNYTTLDGLSNNFITSIAESRTSPGTIYVGTIAGGLCEFSHGHFRTIPVGNNVIGPIKDDLGGTIWCIAYDGLYTVHEGRVTQVFANHALASDFDLAITPDSLVWFSFNRRLYVLRPLADKVSEVPSPVSAHAIITCMAADRDTSLWVGTSDSTIIRLRDGRLVSRRKIGFGAPSTITDDGRASLWVTLDNGLLEIDRKSFATGTLRRYTQENGLQETHTTSALIDREHILWVGSWSKGLAKLPDDHLLKIPLDHTLRVHEIHMATSNIAPHAWIATDAGLLEMYRDAQGNWDQAMFPFSPRRAGKGIHSLVFDPEGRLWVRSIPDSVLDCYRVLSTPGGASRLAQVERLDLRAFFPGSWLVTFLIDRNNDAWCAFDSAGVAVIDLATKKLVKLFTQADGVPGRAVHTLFQDKAGNIWLGGWSDGLSFLQSGDLLHGRLRKFTTADGLPDNGIRSMCEDPQGRLWIGTRFGGLALFQDNRFRAISSRDGLLSNAVWSLSADSCGRLWLATDLALECVDARSASPLPGEHKLLGEMVNSCGVWGKSTVWFTTTDALNICEVNAGSPGTPPPMVHISRFLVNGKSIDMQPNLRLTHDENNCTIEFFGISFNDERDVRYRYMMEGVDRDWHASTAQRAVTYAALRPGRYTFVVNALNKDGVTSGLPASAAFVITPPYWEQWWFLAASAAGLGAIVLTVANSRMKRTREIESIRARISRDLHDDIGSALTRITILSDVAIEQASTGQEHRAAPPDRNSPVEEEPSVMNLLMRIGQTARELHESISDVAWSLDPAHDSVRSVIGRLRSFATDLCEGKGVALSFTVQPAVEQLRGDPRFIRTLLLIGKEGITNALRHSSCTALVVSLSLGEAGLRLSVEDNGTGFDQSKPRHGSGVSNMQKRAEMIVGRVSIHTDEGKGTRIEAILPTR